MTDDARDCAVPDARLTNARKYNWIHPLGNIVSGLITAGLRLPEVREGNTARCINRIAKLAA